MVYGKASIYSVFVKFRNVYKIVSDLIAVRSSSCLVKSVNDSNGQVTACVERCCACRHQHLDV